MNNEISNVFINIFKVIISFIKLFFIKEGIGFYLVGRWKLLRVFKWFIYVERFIVGFMEVFIGKERRINGDLEIIRTIFWVNKWNDLCFFWGRLWEWRGRDRDKYLEERNNRNWCFWIKLREKKIKVKDDYCYYII